MHVAKTGDRLEVRLEATVCSAIGCFKLRSIGMDGKRPKMAGLFRLLGCEQIMFRLSLHGS
jgi:hypothetical protein